MDILAVHVGAGRGQRVPRLHKSAGLACASGTRQAPNPEHSNFAYQGSAKFAFGCKLFGRFDTRVTTLNAKHPSPNVAIPARRPDQNRKTATQDTFI
jgi:hypothetical protein